MIPLHCVEQTKLQRELLSIKLPFIAIISAFISKLRLLKVSFKKIFISIDKNFNKIKLKIYRAYSIQLNSLKLNLQFYHKSTC